MTHILKTFISIIFIQLSLIKNNECFSNFFSEIFDDLRIGSLDKDYLSQKFDNSRLKCVQGSHFFNGSCYFISNKKYTEPAPSIFESDLSILNYLNKKKEKAKLTAKNGVTELISSLPTDTTWNNAVKSCLDLNNDSSLIYFNNDMEYEFLIGLLTKLNFPSLLANQEDSKVNRYNQQHIQNRLYNEEQKYYIGLTHNDSVWKWLNGMNLTKPMIEKFSLNNINYDKYRKCAYLNLRDNGNVKIELTNCNNERQPYICKYIMDRCFNNTSCGKNGECINVPSQKSFECRCRIFYAGENCDKWSTQGLQMLITVSLVTFAFAIVIFMKVMNEITFSCFRKKKQTNNVNKNKNQDLYYKDSPVTLNPLLPQTNKQISVIRSQINPFKSISNMFRRKLKLSLLVITSLTTALVFLLTVSAIRSQMIEYKIEQYQKHFSTKSSVEDGPASPVKDELVISELDQKTTSRFTLVLSYDICKLINDQFFEDYILIFISFPITAMIYLWNAYKCNRDHDYHCRFGNLRMKRKNREKNINYTEDSSRSISQLSSIENSSFTEEKPTNPPDASNPNRISTISTGLCYTFSVLGTRLRQSRLRKFTMCTLLGMTCSCNFKLPVPVNPFSKRNRFITAVIYAAYTYNILKIFEYLIVGDKHIQESNRLLERAKMLQNQSLHNLTNSVMNKFDEASRFAERGILMDLLKQVCNVIIIGLRYYPVLLCVELKRKSKFCYFITSLYVLLLFFSYIYMNIFCLLSASNAIKDATNQYDNSIQNKLSFSSLGELRSNRMLAVPAAAFLNNNSATTVSVNTLNKSSDAIRQSLTTPSLFEVNRRRSGISINIPSFNQQNRLIDHSQHSSMIQTLNSSKTQTWSLMKLNSSDFDSIKKSLFIDNIMYEKFLFYAVLCLITFNIVFEFLWLMKRSIQKRCCKSKAEQIPDKNKSLYRHEISYTTQMLNRQNSLKPVSFVRHLFEKYVYKNHPSFRYPKQFINTQIIAFVLLYYITCIIIRKSALIVSLSSNVLILIINFIFQSASSESNSFILNSRAQLNALIKSLFDHIATDIIVACCLTSGIYLMQLFLGIRNYQRHVLNAYKGVYIDIPSPKSFSNTKLASSSLHYSGYAIGYLLWGYLILFEVIVVVTVIIKFLIKFYFITENLAKVLLPITTIFLFKRIIIWYLSRFFLTNSSSNKRFVLRNHKLYFILNHFNFFFDCFLGSFVCFVRMAKSSMAALFFMPRLDYSIFGRYLERTDMGFISYVTFIHMDVNQSHPVKAAFCELLIRNKPIPRSRPVNRTARNRWFLAVTLAKNPGLKKQRKHYLFILNKIQKVESFEQFLERRVKIFFGTDTKKRSRSTPNLLDERDTKPNSAPDILNSQIINLNYEQKTSTVNYRNEMNNNNNKQVMNNLSVEARRERFARSRDDTGTDDSYYVNEQFGREFMNTTILTNDTILNYSDEYSPKSNDC